MRINQKTVLVSGASRGIGRALVDEALARGASRVFAGARSEAALDSLARIDSRVQPLKLDVTRQEDIEAAAGTVGKLDLLINNAGSLTGYSLLSSQRKAVEADFAVNFWGALEVTKAFVAKLEASQGAVLNVLTLVSMASMPAIGGYSASKAAAWSMTQALRAELSARSIQVFAAYPGSVDTDMIRAFEMPKTDPSVVAANMLAAVESGTIDSFPDPMSEQAGSAWLGDPRSLEAMFAKM